MGAFNMAFEKSQYAPAPAPAKGYDQWAAPMNVMPAPPRPPAGKGHGNVSKGAIISHPPPPPPGAGKGYAPQENKMDGFLGTIKTMNMQAGYGMIACSGTHMFYQKDVFFSCTLLPPGLQIGSPVAFTIKVGDKGPAATSITPVYNFSDGSIGIGDMTAMAAALASSMGLAPAMPTLHAAPHSAGGKASGGMAGGAPVKPPNRTRRFMAMSKVGMPREVGVTLAVNMQAKLMARMSS